MRQKMVMLPVILYVATVAPSAYAHHSHPYFYDECNSITIEGRVEGPVLCDGCAVVLAPSANITGDKIIVNGIRFPYVNAQMPQATNVPSFGQLNGSLNTCLGLAPAAVLGNQPSKFRVITLDPSIPAGRVDNRFFPFRSGSALSAAIALTHRDWFAKAPQPHGARESVQTDQQLGADVRKHQPRRRLVDKCPRKTPRSADLHIA